MLVFLILIASLGVIQDHAMAQKPADAKALDDPNPMFHDDLLDNLVGRWNITGIVHGNPSRQSLDAD